jgi:dephospho-CoA kinase
MILTVEANPELQIERIVRSRGLSEQEAAARLAAQATKIERAERADFVIDSSGTHTQLETQVQLLWAKIEQAAKDKKS